MAKPAIVDLRSDTVTKPDAAMRRIMAEAEVGDDVYGEDPCVLALQSKVASLLGKPAALFTSSGTMANQLAVACATRPGDEVILGEGAHLAFYEVGAAAVLSGVQFAVAGQGGLFDAAALRKAVKPRAYYTPRSSLVCVENTHNRAGGKVSSGAQCAEVVAAARELGLATHLDGARLWNAAIALGVTPASLAEGFDTVSVCFSKGLGAPVGSMLLGDERTIEQARRLRKTWGGGMRQIGMLAAAASYALDHHYAGLADDHALASRLGDALADHPALQVVPPETNVLLLDLAGPASAFVSHAREAGVLVGEWAERRVRLVTHRDIDRNQEAHVVRVLRAAANALSTQELRT